MDMCYDDRTGSGTFHCQRALFDQAPVSLSALPNFEVWARAGFLSIIKSLTPVLTNVMWRRFVTKKRNEDDVASPLKLRTRTTSGYSILVIVATASMLTSKVVCRCFCF